jgi:hypothetical protein
MVTRKERLQSELAVVENQLTVAKLANALAEVLQLKNEVTNLKAARDTTVRLKPRGDPHPQILILSLYHLPEVRNATTGERAEHRAGRGVATKERSDKFEGCKGHNGTFETTRRPTPPNTNSIPLPPPRIPKRIDCRAS